MNSCHGDSAPTKHNNQRSSQGGWLRRAHAKLTGF
jgi:hypothetical protein